MPTGLLESYKDSSTYNITKTHSRYRNTTCLSEMRDK